MKQGRLLIAALLLATLAGLFWWSNKKEAAATKAPATPTTTKILEVPQDQIQSLTIEKAGSEGIALKRIAGKWSITAPRALPADQDAVSTLLSTFGELNADKLLDEKAPNLEQFGLTKPSLSVTATKQDGKTIKLLFGDETPTGSGSY